MTTATLPAEERRTADGRVLLLRTCQSDGSSYNGFRWPLTVGARVDAPDWDRQPRCGGGLHGLLWGVGNGGLLCWDEGAVWMVFAAEEFVCIDDQKAKVPRAEVVFIGPMKDCAEYLVANGAAGLPIVGGTATAGDSGTATAGYSGTATAGYSGTATAGDRGTATAGYRGTATAGYSGTATAGYSGTATAGYSGTATAGDRGTATAGDSGTATAGDRGTATAGDRGTATAGDRGTATAGYRGTATAGYSGTATAGADGVIAVSWWDTDRQRYRVTIGYIGEDGLEPGVPYRCDELGKFVRAEVDS